MTAAEALAGLLARDPATWKADPEHQRVIRNALGWLDVPVTMEQTLPELEAFAAGLTGLRAAVLVGMGGSSLAPDVLSRMFPARRLPLHVLDTTAPDAILALRRSLDLERTLVIVSSKSGTTTEAVALYRYFWQESGGAGDRFVAITDPGTWLHREAEAKGFRRVFLNPPDIGGRYSALSYFGLVPAVVHGIDVAPLLAGARDRLAEPGPAAELGAALAEHAQHGRDKVTLLTATPFGDWLEQLLAESTGKEGKGLIPVAGEPEGPPEVYGDDRIFVYLDRPGTLRPSLTVPLGNLGEAFLRWEIATAVAGALLGIDAFDQPNVQESKDNTVALLRTYAETGRLPEEETVEADALADFLLQSRPGDYIALMAYLPPFPEVAAAVAELRLLLRDRLRRATTVGFGPRFLHSTGQIHKGGPNTCVAVQLTCTPAEDVPVPEAPYSFATLWRAQASGDLQALRRHGRRAVRIELGSDPTTALARLRQRLAKRLPTGGQ
jgi:transaldolase/glucose-6-phosphate isomerase